MKINSNVITHTHIKAGSPKKFLEFLRYKQLVYFFTWREFKVRYKQTVFGVAWAVLEPLLFAGVIWLILTKRAGLSFGFEGVSDLVIIFISFSMWQFFNGGFGGAANSISSNKALAKKIYFPKVILLLSVISSKTLDFALQTIALMVLIVITGSHVNLIGIPLLLISLFLTGTAAFALSLFLAPLNVKYRDVSIILPFVLRIMFFTTPIWYPFHIIPDWLQQILLFNPVVPILEFTRSALFGAPDQIAYDILLYPLVTISVLLMIGIPWFKRKEGRLADYM